MKQLEYFVVTARVVGGDGQPFVIEHYAGEPYTTKARAVKSGFQTNDSDDFFIGVAEMGGPLIRFENIDEPYSVHAEDLQEIAEQIGRKVRWRSPDDKSMPIRLTPTETRS